MKSFDFQRFCEDYNIPTFTQGHKHTKTGWINTECPLCEGNQGYHLGFEMSKNRFHCWRCKAWKKDEIIMKLASCSRREVKSILKSYGGKSIIQEVEEAEHADECKLPVGCGDLTKRHRKYLRSRKFDPDQLIDTWSLQGTGPVGPYKFRIIAPIYHEGRMVSFQGRDITGKQPLPYKACEKAQEERGHKTTLYGGDLTLGGTVVVCEGIVDAWRLGVGAVATFGVAYTPSQVNLLRKYDKVYILYDNDEPAVQSANKLGWELSAFTEVEIISIEYDDPGVMPQDEADELMKHLLLG